MTSLLTNPDTQIRQPASLLETTDFDIDMSPFRVDTVVTSQHPAFNLSSARLSARAQVWRAGLAALSQQWPALPALLAAAAVQRLLSRATLASGDASHADRWASWVVALMPAASAAAAAGGHQGGAQPQPAASNSEQRSGSKRKRPEAARPADSAGRSLWLPAPDQAAVLLKRCLAAASGVDAAGTACLPVVTLVVRQLLCWLGTGSSGSAELRHQVGPGLLLVGFKRRASI